MIGLSSDLDLSFSAACFAALAAFLSFFDNLFLLGIGIAADGISEGGPALFKDSWEESRAVAAAIAVC